jgi:[acyl-carrier-protein] S-malonyltransferase
MIGSNGRGGGASARARVLAAGGATHIVECGPGKVLAGMTKRIAPEVQSFTLSDRAALENALGVLFSKPE